MFIPFIFLVIPMYGKPGIYGALFRRNKEAAFSNYRLWESIGFVITYVVSTYMCADEKLYMLFGVLSAGVLGYVVVEIRQYRKEKRLKKQEQEAKSIEQRETAAQTVVDESDDEKDDLEEDIVVTHL